MRQGSRSDERYIPDMLWPIGLICGLMLVASALQSPVAARAAESTLPEELERISAPVTIDGQTLFRLRGVSAYPAEQRARVIAGRIEALAADETISIESLEIIETEGRSVISAGDQPVMNVFDADAAFENMARQPLALLYRVRMAEAIAAYRHDRSPRELLIGTGHAAAATVFAAGLIWAIRRLFSQIGRAHV